MCQARNGTGRRLGDGGQAELGCAGHHRTRHPGQGISQLQVLYDTILAEPAVVKADREVPEC